MNKIELNHWYMNENELSISLMRFYTKIKILKNNQTVYYQLYINGKDNKELTLNFYTIEDAILFTEQIIAKSCNTNEILEKYNLMFENKVFINPYSKKRK